MDKSGRLTACKQDTFNGDNLFCEEESALIKQSKIYKAPIQICITYSVFCQKHKQKEEKKKKISSDLAPKTQTLEFRSTALSIQSIFNWLSP